MNCGNLASLGFGHLDPMSWRKPHFPCSPGTTSTLSCRKCLCPSPADPYLSGDPWRPWSQIALDVSFSFNQVGHVGREALLVVLLYFFVAPVCTQNHNGTRQHFCRWKKKRSVEFLLHFQRSVAWESFYSGAHLMRVCGCATFSVDVLWPVSGQYLLWQD